MVNSVENSQKKWEAVNVLAGERKTLTQDAVRKFKQRIEAQRYIRELDEKEVRKMNGICSNPEVLKNADERTKFLGKMEMRLTILVVMLIRSGKLKYDDFKSSNVTGTIADLFSKRESLKVKSGSGMRTLNYQEKTILDIARRLPGHQIDAVKNQWAGLERELLLYVKAMDFSTQIAMADAQGQRVTVPKKLSKTDKNLWDQAQSMYQRQHPVTKGLLIAAGAFGAIKALGWLGRKLFGSPASKTVMVRDKNGKTNAMNIYVTPKKSFLGRVWTWTKRALFMGTGVFVAGMLLNDKKVYGFLGRKLKKMGINVDENRITKAMIHFSELKFLDAFMTLVHGHDKNEDLHKRMADKLPGLRGESSLLWYMGNVKFDKFHNHDYRAKKRSLALGLIGVIPGLSLFFNQDDLIKKEEKLKVEIDKYLKVTKFVPKTGMTMDEVLKEIDKRVISGGRFDRATQVQLNKTQKNRTERQRLLDETKEKSAKDSLAAIERRGSITEVEKKKLLAESKDLLKEAQVLKEAIAPYWVKFLESLNKMGLPLAVFAPKHKNSGEKIDSVRARKIFLAQFAKIGQKGDERVFNEMFKELNGFQRFVTSLQPGNRMSGAQLSRLRKLKESLFGNNKRRGYYFLLKEARRNANDKTVADYRHRLQTGKVTVRGVKTALANGLFSVAAFSFGYDQHGNWQGNVWSYARFYAAIAAGTIGTASAVFGQGRILSAPIKGVGYALTWPAHAVRGVWKLRKLKISDQGIGHHVGEIMQQIRGITPRISMAPAEFVRFHPSGNGSYYKYGNGQFHITNAELKAAGGDAAKACSNKYAQSFRVEATRVNSAGYRQYKMNGKWVTGEYTKGAAPSQSGIEKARARMTEQFTKQGFDISGNQINNPKVIRFYDAMKNVLGPAIAAKMAYDLFTAKDKKRAVAGTAISIGIIMTGSTLTAGLLKNVVKGQRLRGVISMLAGIGAAWGLTGTVYNWVDDYLSFYGDKQIYGKVSQMLEQVFTYQFLRSQMVRQVARGTTSLSLRIGLGIGQLFSRGIGRKIGQYTAQSTIKRLAASLGFRGAVAGTAIAIDTATDAIPVIGWFDKFITVGAGIWLGADIYQIVKLTNKALTVNNEMKKRNAMQVKGIKFPDARSRQAFEYQLRKLKGYSTGMSFEEMIKQTKDHEVMRVIQMVPDFNVIIERPGNKSEKYHFVRGQVWSIELFENGKKKVGLTQEELSQKIKFPPPKQFKKWKIEPEKMDNGQAEASYNIAVMYLKNECGWTRMDHQVINKNLVRIKRLDYRGQKLDLVHEGSGKWKINGNSYGGNMDFFQAVALANLCNKVKGLIKKEKHNPGSSKPFSLDGDNVDFDKKWNPNDLRVLQKGSWWNFYTQVLKIPKQMVVDVLNGMSLV